jgi:predicted alpha/beta hydrolase family esterase
MTKNRQLFLIHGGMTFKNRKDYLRYLKTREVSLEKYKSWTGGYLDEKLGKRFQIIRPRMPLADNAKYQDWKIAFERYFPYLKNGLVLLGVSLGGIFLAKYLSENKFPKKIGALYLVCPPFDNTLPGEDLVGGFRLKADLSLITQNAKNVYLLFSKDDATVPPSQAAKYRAKLKQAEIVVYKSKNGHFQVPTFPEIVRMIKKR